ncbi:MAG: hypothetical protein AAF645_17875, partial [Myxococcota bacterium]
SRARYLVMLQGLGVGDPWSVYTTALKEGSETPGGLSAREIRGELEAMLEGDRDEERELAIRALLAMGHRGALLAHRGAGRDLIVRLIRGS